MRTPDDMWDWIVGQGIATEDELRLVSCINGHNENTYNSVLYARTGYRSIDQIEDMEEE